MNPTRRSFMKVGTGVVAASVLGFDLKTAYAQAKELKIPAPRKPVPRVPIAR
jgi:hypothetical protein